MPWKEESTMSLRREFIQMTQTADANIRSLCRRFGISPKTGYKWIQRYRESGGAAQLADRSRRPLNSPHRTSAEVEETILRVRHAHPCWGGRKIRARLVNLGHHQVPSASTVTSIMHRNGCIDPVESTKHTAWQRFEAPEPNALWQMDFKGHFPLVSGIRCHPLTILDDYSRYALALIACANETYQSVSGHLVTTFRHYGMPERMLVDNGPPWGTRDEYRYTGLTVWLVRLGIGVVHARALHPQTLGKDERFHRTLRAEVIGEHTFRDLTECQRYFDDWRPMYNDERPHEALNLNVPVSRYQMSRREFPEILPPIEYGPGDHVRKVQGKGEISFRNRVFNIGKAFKGYPVAVRPTLTDAVFDVFFCTQKVAQINFNDDITVT